MGLRATVLLLLAAAPVAAQELPLIRASGTSLETFEVELRLEGVDHATAEGLAKSFARFEEEHHGVSRRFGELVRDAHLDLLRRTCTRDIVDRQAKAYEAAEQKGYRSEVTGVTPAGDKALARLRRTYLAGGKEREEATEIDLVRDGTRWRIAAIRNRGRDGQWKERGLGTPPTMMRAEVPAPGTPDLSSPRSTVSSLRGDVLRFGALRFNAQLAVPDRFFDIAAAFYGEEVARKARESRPRLETARPLSVEFGEPAPRLSDLVRIEVTVNDEVGGKRKAVAQRAFDLRPEEGTWRIVGEYMRPEPEGPYQSVPGSFGLFFLPWK